MDDDFDAAFADELEALDEIGREQNIIINRTRKSLSYDTPSKKIVEENDDLDNSLLPLPESPYDADSLAPSHKCSSINSVKRPRDEGLSPRIRISNSAPNKKRKTTECDEFDDHFVTTDLPNFDRDERKSIKNQDYIRGDGFDWERKRVLGQVPYGDFISVSWSYGPTSYMKVRSEMDFAHSVQMENNQVKLLNISVQDLKQQLEKERTESLLKEAKRLTQDVRQHQNDFVDYNEDRDGIGESEGGCKELLWVEKYTPKHYTHLLSEEMVNRALLHWIRLWDYVVFGKDIKLHKKDKKKKDSKKKVLKQLDVQEEEELDLLNRPLHKVVMLSGPPGLGKTTLARIIANHAGYNAVEMNASDDRTIDVFKTKIESTTQMKSVLEADPRPNCLVIDEIDGAPQPAINILLSIIKRGETKTGKKKEEPLRRPIICICNELYTPSLRQLRASALVLTFPPTEPSRLASRLQEIIKRESIRADINTLLALCDKAGNDIRTCLNTLQFIQSHAKELTTKIIHGLNIGNKDVQKSFFSLWDDIFKMPRQLQNKFVSLFDINENSELVKNKSSLNVRFHNILQMTYAAGEYEKVTQGIYENYLDAKCKDPHLHSLTTATEWLQFVDIINKYTGCSQDYSLMKYVPYISVLFHLLFASTAAMKVQYPQKQYEMQTKISKSQNLVTAMFLEMSPIVRKYINIEVLSMEVLSPLIEIIQPNLRPINTQLYSNREKEELKNLIQIMIAYNMTYRQEKNLDGQYNYILEPKLNELTSFPGLKQRKTLTYAAKQLISREIDLEKMRRNENPNDVLTKSHGKAPEHKAENAGLDHAMKIENEIFKKKDIGQKDFFGRVVKPVEAEKKKEAENKKKSVLDTVIWFQFQEGYTNAVKRNVRVQDFL